METNVWNEAGDVVVGYMSVVGIIIFLFFI